MSKPITSKTTLTKEILMARTVQQGECRIWTGSVNKKTGYGAVWDSGRTRQAHIVSYERHRGLVPPGMVVMHSCDRPACINPDHLSAGTHSENTKDMVAKGRANRATGEKHGRSKLTEEQVAMARRRYKPYSRTDGSYALARELGVRQSTILDALKGTTWTKK